MSNKTDLWDRLGKTDPAHTTPFKRAGGFAGTSIKPMWSFHRMTEEFGPCGIGWGVNEPLFQVVQSVDEALVFCTVSIWHGVRDNTVFGVGGDKVFSKRRDGTFTDDEAFKKAYTDAITNALKLIGVGADVHMGMHDDNKYVNEMRLEFSENQDAGDEGDASRKRFVDECVASINRIGEPHRNPKELLLWWNSEVERKKRRDFDLTPAEVIMLKALVNDKVKR